jgi:hypothetical protein
METWWSDCGLHTHETRLPGFYVQMSTLDSGKKFANKDDLDNVSVHVLPKRSENTCRGTFIKCKTSHDRPACLQLQPSLVFDR